MSPRKLLQAGSSSEQDPHPGMIFVYPFGFVWFRVRSAREARAVALWKDCPRMCSAEQYAALSRTKKADERKKKTLATRKDLRNSFCMIGI
jgi:hypothetical protein